MAEFTYETVDGTKTGFIPNVGEIKDGKITTVLPVNNPNLKLISGNAPQNSPVAPVVGTASQQNPNQPATAESAPTNTGVQL